MTHDNYLHDHLSDELAAYEARLEAKFQEIRSELTAKEFASEIEEAASLDEKVSRAITSVFCGEDGSQFSRIANAFADAFLDDKAMRFAIDALSREVNREL